MNKNSFFDHVVRSDSAGNTDLWTSFLAVANAGVATVTRRERTGTDLTFNASKIEKSSVKLALQLKAAGAQAEDCVLLVNKDPMAFVCGFWACQAAGLTAVAMPPMGTAVQVERTRAALGVLGRAWVLTEDVAARDALIDAPEVAGAFVLSGESFDHLEGVMSRDTPESTEQDRLDPESIAVIMFSSGSTGDPKGVELSHRAILAQIAMLQEKMSLTLDDCFVNWMPMSHDFGLFQFHILPLLSGVPQVLMATDDFARHPVSWLRLIQDHGGTITGAPNLALQMVNNLLKPQRAAQLDLGLLRCIMLGAEPLDPNVMRTFADKLKPSRFNSAALTPAFGLAEATLVVTMRSGLQTVHMARRSLEAGEVVTLLGPNDSDAVELPLLGKPVKDAVLRIVDENELSLPPDTVGHLQVRCNSVMRGYRNRQDESQQALRPGGWLATGDIGFIHQDEFVMVGRAKDVIICGGRNYHPADLERIAQAAPGLSPLNQVAIVQGRDPSGTGVCTVAFLRGRNDASGALKDAVTTHLVAQSGVELDHVLLVRDLPRTTSGKLQRHALACAYEQGAYADLMGSEPEAASPESEAFRRAIRNGNVSALASRICDEAERLGGAPVGVSAGLMDQGVSSRQAVALCARLGAWLGKELSIATLFDYPSPFSLAQALIRDASPSEDADVITPLPISVNAPCRLAVIGYGCRLPGAETPQAFWDLLNTQRQVVAPIPPDRWMQSPGDLALPPAALLTQIDAFDFGFFGLTRSEAEAMNPVQRLLLQVLWQSLEHAGLDVTKMRGKRVGLFVGLSDSGLATGRGETVADGDALAGYAVSGSAGSIAVGRMAHLFDFRGPALAVDTACSSSIVALDLAAQALRQGSCDIAIAGAANLILAPDLHAALHSMGALSPDGLCKTFAATADGYGRGEGAGLVVLKRLDDAQRDCDTLRAELLATTLNHDGQSASVTAPNGRAQRDLLRRALQEAALAGDDLDWVETHGTGTALGDPVELEALRDVLRGKAGRPLPIGAVKSRIGHLEAAAGIAGVIKILLALQHGSVPPDRSCELLNDRFDWEAGGLAPIVAPLDWSGHSRRLAGVASFGMSGTNAYAILSSPPRTPVPSKSFIRPLVLALSVKNEAALAPLQKAWTTELDGQLQERRADLVAGQANRRTTGPLRCAAQLPPVGSLHAAMETPLVKSMTEPRLIFAYPGQGAQSAEMGADLYRSEPVYRTAFDAASDAAGLVQGRPLTEWLYGDRNANADRINQTDLSQPALVAFGYALGELWGAMGLRPDAVLGHSVGEIGAALASGQITLDVAMRLAVRRGELMQDCADAGAMLALRADEETARGLIQNLPDTVIASYNGPMALSLSGPVEQIAELQARTEAAGIVTAPIRVNRAFHSPAMAQAADSLLEGLDLEAQPGLIPVYSTLTGMLAEAGALAEPQYWRDQMLQPVSFLQAAQAAAAPGNAIFLEIGSGALLSGLGAVATPNAVWIKGGDSQEALALTAGKVWSYGGAIDWEKYYGTRGASGDQLPRYPMLEEQMPRRPVRAMTMPVITPVQGVTIGTTDLVEQVVDPVLSDPLSTEILPIIARVCRVAPDQIASDAPLISLGLDSLGMVQLQRELFSRLALKVDLRDLVETFDTARKLADLLLSTRPVLTPSDKHPAAETVALGTQLESGPLAEVMRTQLKMVEDVIARQLQVISGVQSAPPVKISSPVSASHPVGGEIKGLFSQPKKLSSDVSSAQQVHVGALAEQWNARSSGSKAAAQSARTHLANSRAIFGFAPHLKELTYPLMADRAEGAYVWDVDGNRYVDVTMGFGVYLFGHKCEFVIKSLQEELDRGAAIGPATPLAEQVAERIHALTGAERSAFFTTGTEAIMCAVRIARAVTGRQKIVIFKGAYHGSFDGVLATGWIDDDGTPQTAPMTDGTLQGMVEPAIVLEYGDMAGLNVIERYADDIALVLVEPVQSRNPENRPVDYLHALRDLTRARDIPLLFDEVISGFRFAPGGMQELFEIEADLVTYGKVLGHGQPIGVLCGSARYMDAVDGGAWSYGDDSAPGTRTAFVAGTFNGHPMALAAARAVLDHIRDAGAEISAKLAARTEAMCQTLDSLFVAEDVPVRMERFGSLFRFNYGPGAEILNTHLLNNGVFVWEQRNCFLSTAHDETDVALIVQAATQGIAAMKSAGWFGAVKSPDWSQHLPASAGELVLRRRAALVCPGTWTDLVLLRFGTTRLTPDMIASAWAQISRRHPALRACLAPDGSRRVGDAATAPFETCALDLGSHGFDAALDVWIAQALTHVFAFDCAPIRLSLLEGDEQILALTSSHLGFDGWSLALILSEISQILEGGTLDPVDVQDSYRQWEQETTFFRSDTAPLALALPIDGPDPESQAPRGQRETHTDIAPLYVEIAQVARKAGITPLAAFMAPYVVLLGWLSGQGRVTVGVPVAGQVLSGCFNLVGNLSFVRPVSVDLTPDITLSELGRQLHFNLLEPGSRPPLDTLPERHALFNLDGPIGLGQSLSGATLHKTPISGARADLFLNLLRVGDQVVLDYDWNSDRFSAQAAGGWLEAYLALAQRFVTEDLTLSDAFRLLKSNLPQQQLSTLDTKLVPDWNVADQLSTNLDAELDRALTATEVLLAGIWQELLGMPITRPDADFFQLGGGSLQAVRLLGQLTTQFGTEMSLDWLFAKSRLSEMAAALDLKTTASNDLPSMRTHADRVPALPQQQQLHLLTAVSDAGPAYNICLRLDFSYRLTEDVLARAMRQVARKHASLRISFDWGEDQLDQVIAAEPVAELSPKRLTPGDDETAVLDAFAQSPISADEKMLWQIGLLDRTNSGSTLVLVLHHIISDAWSAEILVRDLLDAYQRDLLGADPLPMLTQDFPDYALWVAGAKKERALALDYWRSNVAAAPVLTTLPGDYSRPPVKSFVGARASRRLKDALSRRIQRRARELRTTPFQIILTALVTHVAELTNQSKLVIGTVSAGRSRPYMDQVIGFFANILPLYLDLPLGQSSAERIALIQAALFKATAHDLISLQEIVADLGLQPDPSANPLFEICVTHDDRRGLTQISAELGFEFSEVILPTTQFDLSFYVIETGHNITLDVTFSTAIYKGARIETLLDDVLVLLEQVCDNTDAPADHISKAEAAYSPQNTVAPCVTIATPQMQEPTAKQKRLWFVDRFENGVLYDAAPSYYNMAGQYALDPSVTSAMLDQRLVQLSDQVPALNVAFNMRSDRPHIINAKPNFAPCCDLGAKEVDGFVDAPFDLAAGGLLRLARLAQPDGTLRLLLVVHHILIDLRGLDQLANVLLEGLVPPDLMSTDVAPMIAQAVAETELAFWRETLGANPARLLLPVDHARAAIHVFGRGSTTVHLDAEACVAFDACARQLDVLPDDLILAGLVALLHRLSGQDRIVLGQTFPRSCTGLATHDNLVTLNIALDAEQSTLDTIVAIERQARLAESHGQMDFDAVVLDLKPENDMSRTALFDILIVRDSPTPQRCTPGAIGWGKYDLVLAPLRRADGGIELGLTFNTCLFKAETISHWGDMLAHLLRILPQSGDCQFGLLPLMPETAVAPLLAAGTPRLRDLDVPFGSVPDALIAAAEVNPKASALWDEGGGTSYSALVTTAFNLAHLLIAEGVQRGDRVAVLLPRGSAYVCAMLAVMQAGAAFVPLDMDAAPKRTAQVLEDAKVSCIIVSGAKGVDLLPSDIRLLDIDAPSLDEGVRPALPKLTVTDAAYIIFTSGSTGRPKGVVVEHGNLLALVLGQGGIYPVAPGDRWSWFHSPAFDFSIWEVWGALLTRGEVVVIPDAARTDMALFRQVLSQQKVAQLSLTPSVFRALSDEEMSKPDGDLTIQAVWFGGEALTPIDLQPWAQRYIDCCLINLFGITETTVHTTFRPLTIEDLNRSDSPIGAPLPSYGLTIRDAGLRPVPAGIQGEIVVSGSGLARGYLGQPIETAARFVVDPHDPSVRLYRSGDLGRMGLDGEVTYLGRADDQVKLRGYRIELGEVETALNGHAQVRAAAAGVLADHGSDAILAVWITLGGPLDLEPLNAHLVAALPAYMIPRRIFVVDSLPLTPNGKINRKALQGMTDHPLGEASDAELPYPGLETRIAEILCELLDRPSITRTESFFALGGHSLMANSAVLRLRAQLGMKLNLREFFAAQSVAALATLGVDEAVKTDLTVRPVPDAAGYPLSSAQTRLFAMQTSQPDSSAYNMVGGFIIDGALNRHALGQAFVDLINRHEILRTRFVARAGVPEQVVDPPIVNFDLFEITFPLGDTETAITHGLSPEFTYVFDLAQGPLLRAGLGRLGKESWLLVLNLHHIISDGWSVPIMMADLSSFYANCMGAKESELPEPLAIHYRDFACWQAAEPALGILDAAHEHWTERFGAGVPVTSLTTDVQRPMQRSGTGWILRHKLDAATSASLRTQLSRKGTTLFTVSAAVLHILLRLRGAGDGATVIGTADAGRNLIEIEDQLGFYLNLVPHVLNLDAERPLSDWLHASMIETGAMLGHKSAPFEKMLDALELRTEPGHNPVFDILLLVQNNAAIGANLGQHSIRALPDQTRTARYDLNLMVEDFSEIELVLEYDTALFNKGTVEWILKDFVLLLEGFVNDLDRSPLDLLTTTDSVQSDKEIGLLDADDPLLGGL